MQHAKCTVEKYRMYYNIAEKQFEFTLGPDVIKLRYTLTKCMQQQVLHDMHS